ncbi:GNAT family N-acetyltransferase [Mesorhizobium sp. 1M-11]|uniref:GNAT family N-acetyltransferase n=1 Tax=Mesorhizobium sp. 1M-11 TaxID=1529006 RepID=UPI0006C7374A|nr:GNAT family N-acetyltransferase [Mesorhizobium sp. 1M-11]
MADATASEENKAFASRTAPHLAPAAAAITASVQAATEDAISSYAEFSQTALHAPPQDPLWVRHWVEHLRPDAIIASLMANGQTTFALALEIERSGPFRVARFLGGRHANGNFPATSAAFGQNLAPSWLPILFEAIKSTRPDIDLIALQRLQPDLDGISNPLAALPSFPSPNLALAVDLDGGFDSVLERASGKRKRKKHRSQARKFEAAGGFARIEARTTADARRLLDAFFAMKEQRFRKMGISNVFGDERVRSFFQTLFASALDDDNPAFILHGLEVAGKLRAVTGSSRSPKRLVCEFGAILEDELSFASPGDFLFFDNIQEACRHGNVLYDFSVGDEPYKRQWCDVEIRQCDALVPLTTKGRTLAGILHQGARAKAFIKNNPMIWKVTKALRRRAQGQEPTPGVDEN